MGTIERIRIINEKTGDVKFVSKIVADNAQALAMYGFKIQHLEKKEAVIEPVKVEEKKAISEEEAINKMLNQKHEEKSEFQVLNPTPKKGRKPNKL
jgi:hypothetical protein